MNETPETQSNATLVIGLLVSIAICFTAAAVGGISTASSVDSEWFTTLAKPTWNPPNWLFGPVWSVLYLMMGVSAWLVWKQSGLSGAKNALAWFAFHLLLNVLWSVLFFGLRKPGWAAIEIVMLWLAIAVSIVLFYRHSKLAAGLLIPYLMWVTFATFLNYTIWSLN